MWQQICPTSMSLNPPLTSSCTYTSPSQARKKCQVPQISSLDDACTEAIVTADYLLKKTQKDRNRRQQWKVKIICLSFCLTYNLECWSGNVNIVCECACVCCGEQSRGTWSRFIYSSSDKTLAQLTDVGLCSHYTCYLGQTHIASWKFTFISKCD